MHSIVSGSSCSHVKSQAITVSSLIPSPLGENGFGTALESTASALGKNDTVTGAEYSPTGSSHRTSYLKSRHMLRLSPAGTTASEAGFSVSCDQEGSPDIFQLILAHGIVFGSPGRFSGSAVPPAGFKSSPFIVT